MLKHAFSKCNTTDSPGLGGAAKVLGRDGRCHSSSDRSAVLSPRGECPCSPPHLLCSEATCGFLFHFHNSWASLAPKVESFIRLTVKRSCCAVSRWRCTGHSQGGGPWTLQNQGNFSWLPPLQHALPWALPAGILPQLSGFYGSQPQWWLICYVKLQTGVFSPLCSVCFPHPRALLPFARQG